MSQEKRTVVFVDDSESVREAVGCILQQNGYTVLKAADGEESLKYFEGTPVDLLITDLHMPRMNGIALIQKLRNSSLYKYLPILVLTTESQFEQKMEAKRAGATGWLVKPFTPEKLMAIIRRVIH
ncbi:MAG TPA: response regulator [Bacteroidales bacterium]|nr:response regulator [Bacteroidales bacterium]